MEYENLFFTDNQTQRQIDYLIYNIETLDRELFSSFNINPLREIGLDISSMFYANLCLRLYPLITIAFQVHTFNSIYKGRFDRFYQVKKEGTYWQDIDFDKIIRQLHKLREKNRNDKDHIRDYYKFYAKTDTRIWDYFNLNYSIKPLNHVGLIEYEKEIQPFEENKWNKFLDVRNSIEHRGVIEATLSTVMIGFASLYLLIRGLCYTEFGVVHTFSSEIFGDIDLLSVTLP